MSSSEPAARRFLKQFAIALGGIAAFALVLTWAVDPLSVLYAWGGGLSGRYLRWREDVRSIANEEVAELIEADADAFLDPIAATCPQQRTREQCLFYDPVYFRPEIGAAILAAGSPSQPTGQAGRAAPHPLEPPRQPKTR